MSNFSPKLQDATDEQLLNMINELDFRVVPLASDELTRRSIEKLNQTMKKMDKTSEKYAQAMMNLTFVALFLTLMQILVALVIPNDANFYVKFTTFIIVIIGILIFLKKLLKT